MKLEKVTKKPRRYDDACGTAHGLELIGERWALLVMRELMLGPRRFGDLRSSLPGLSANVLTQRLEGLEASGLVRRETLPPPASVPVYALTGWGLEAEPIIRELGRWAARSPGHDPTLPLSAVSLILSLRTMFDPARAHDAALDFVFGRDRFHARVRDGALISGRDPGAAPEAVIEGEPGAVAGLIYGFAALDDLERDGALKVFGDRGAIARFAAAFELPGKAA
ncbi:transcriptional regulator [Glycocaulis profundi]|nr:transcriptional regulator [Glycocaulis profundi]